MLNLLNFVEMKVRLPYMEKPSSNAPTTSAKLSTPNLTPYSQPTSAQPVVKVSSGGGCSSCGGSRR